MRGLILKDFINLKKNVKIFGVLIILYGGMAFFSEDSSFFSSIFTMLIAILTLTIYSYDEMAKWEVYALTMPISKENIVQGKYIMMLLLTMIGTLISALFTIIINVTLNVHSVFAGIQTCGIGAAIIILFYCINIPFITKMGVEKARLIFFAVYLIPFIIVFLGNKAITAAGITIPENFIQLFQLFLDNIFIILPIVVLISLGISYLISINIYRKKEF